MKKFIGIFDAKKMTPEQIFEEASKIINKERKPLKKAQQKKKS